MVLNKFEYHTPNKHTHKYITTNRCNC